MNISPEIKKLILKFNVYGLLAFIMQVSLVYATTRAQITHIAKEFALAFIIATEATTMLFIILHCHKRRIATNSIEPESKRFGTIRKKF